MKFKLEVAFDDNLGRFAAMYSTGEGESAISSIYLVPDWGILNPTAEDDLELAPEVAAIFELNFLFAVKQRQAAMAQIEAARQKAALESASGT